MGVSSRRVRSEKASLHNASSSSSVAMSTSSHRRGRQSNRTKTYCCFILLLFASLSWILHFSNFITSYMYEDSFDHVQTTKSICSVAKNHFQKGGKLLLYNFTDPSNGPGMASLTINMMQLSMYFHERWNRTMTVIDEEQLKNYRWNQSHGLYSGFLHPNVCVLSKQDRDTFFRLTNDNKNNDLESTVCKYWDMKCQVLEIPADPQGPQFERARRVARRYYLKKRMENIQEKQKPSLQTLNIRFFHDLSRFTCKEMSDFHLQPHVDKLVQDILKRSKIPVDNIGLAFHIRRGDKVAGPRKESRAYSAGEYIERFFNQSSIALGEQSDFGDCFLATDDYSVVTELNDAIRKYKIPCKKLWTLTPPGYKSTWQDRDEILGFLAQVHVLVRATYFVGSFTSNVGGLVALLRGCHLHTSVDRGSEKDHYHHYFHSYGVDWDDWGLL